MKKILLILSFFTSVISYAQLRTAPPVYTSATQTLTNKSIDADNNTITNIEDADIKASAGIDATKISSGLVDNSEFNYLNGLSGNVQTSLNNKITNGGDSMEGDITIGTNDAYNLLFETNNVAYWKVNTDGKLLRNISSSNLGIHLGGTGVGSVIAVGDGFDANTPYVGFREHSGTDTDQGELHANQGLFFTTGAHGSTAKMTIQQDGDVIIGGETQVSGAELTVVGDQDLSGNLNVQGNGTFGSHVKYKTAGTPSTPANGTEFNLYFKSNKIIIQYNDGGTTRYKYLDLTGTGVTWVHTTVAP